MVKDFSQLPSFLKQTNKNIENNAEQLLKDVAIEAGQVLVDNTRVDTGLARSNWQGTLDAPATSVIPPYAPGRRLGLSETANASAAKAQLRATTSLFNIKSNQAIFITNNVFYIGILNDGGPNVPPANFVEKAVQRALDVVRRSKNLAQRR